MSYIGLAELAIAASDLKAVRAVTQAINAGVPGFRGPLGNINTPLKAPLLQARTDGAGGVGGTGDVYEPSPRFEPRAVYTPEPRFEARPVVRPEALVEVPPEPADLVSPLKPVWQMPLPEDAPPGRPVVKVYEQTVDIHHKGSILDRFI
ncbi:MAG: hypothetical protein ACFCVE_07565 [Phycisphaerae bacterium]